MADEASYSSKNDLCYKRNFLLYLLHYFHHSQGYSKIWSVTSSAALTNFNDLEFVCVLTKYNRKDIKILDDEEQTKIARSIIKYLFTENYNMRFEFMFNFFFR
jgi:hypothetical protein